MLNQKAVDVYRAFAQLNRWMYNKYEEYVDTGAMYMPYCNSPDDINNWVNKVINSINKDKIKVTSCYDKPGIYKLNNLNYCEALVLLNLILRDDKLIDSNFDIGCDPNDELHKHHQIWGTKKQLGTIVIVYGLNLIVITVKSGRADLDIEFLNHTRASVYKHLKVYRK